MIKTKKFKGGEIKYKLPNIIQAMRLIGQMGYDDEGNTDKNTMVMFADLLESIEAYVVEIKLGTKVISWEEALNERALLTPLSEVANEILGSINQEGEGRTSRKKA